MTRYITIVTLILLLQCKGEDDFYSNDKILQVTGLQNIPYPVDPYNTVDLTITLMQGSGTKYKRIRLESAGGTFSDPILTISDDVNYGTVKFLPGLIAGTFDIKVSVEAKPEISVVHKITLKAQTIDEVFSVKFSNRSLSATGLDTLQGKIIRNNSKVSSFTLKTTEPNGVFLPYGKNEVTLDVDPASGKIPFTLKIGTIPGDYFVQVKGNDIRNLSMDKPFTLAPLSSDQVLQFAFDKDAINSNGVDIVNGTVSISNYPIAKVRLTSNQGSWVGTAGSKELVITPDATGVGKFSLVSATATGPYHITAQLDQTSFVISNSLKAEIVYPDTIQLEPSAYEIKADQTITIKAFLLNKVGKPSDNLSVSFVATQVQGSSLVEVGSFKNFPFDTGVDQEASATFATDAHKPIVNVPITVTATVSNSQGEVKANSSIKIMPIPN